MQTVRVQQPGQLCYQLKVWRSRHHHHHQSLKRKGRWGTTDDFATSFLHFSLFFTALWDFPFPDVLFHEFQGKHQQSHGADKQSDSSPQLNDTLRATATLGMSNSHKHIAPCERLKHFFFFKTQEHDCTKQIPNRHKNLSTVRHTHTCTHSEKMFQHFFQPVSVCFHFI